MIGEGLGREAYLSRTGDDAPRRRERSGGVDPDASGWRSAQGQLLLIACTWLLTRLLLARDLGWLGSKTDYEDVSGYHTWAVGMLQTHQLPTGSTWQYPIGAALLFLLADVGPARYDATFCLLMFACDLGITTTLAAVGYRERRFRGVWIWLLLTTMFGHIMLLRFDLAPTLTIVVALAVLWTGRRLDVFGALIGAGVLLKVWPLLALVAARSWRELARAGLWCVATLVVVTGAASLYFGHMLAFVSNQAHRGLEVEAVAASPWFLRDAFTQTPLMFRYGSGATDIVGSTANAVASALRILMVLSAFVVAGWWVRRVRHGPPATAAQARDAVLVAVSWYLVMSPVLSPQYFIWLLGLGSLLSCSRETRMQRPLLLLAVAFGLTCILIQGAGQLYARKYTGALDPTTFTCLLLVTRNVLVLGATVDATRILVGRRAGAARHAGPRQSLPRGARAWTAVRRRSPNAGAER